MAGVNEIIQRLLWLLARRSELTEDLAGVERQILEQRGRLTQAQLEQAARNPATAGIAGAPQGNRSPASATS